METRFDELLEFPCIQTFKVMGVADPQLSEKVIEVVQQLAPGDYIEPAIKPSSKGKYHALSVPIKVQSKEHMEKVYTQLSAIDLVRVVI